MERNIAKRNYVVPLTLFMVVCGIAGAMAFRFFMPDRYFRAYPFIPVFFYLLGLVSFYVLGVYRRKYPQKMPLFYMAVKTIKLLLSVAMLILYCVIAKDHIKEFALTFVGFYFLYLIFETWFFSLSR